MTINSIPSAIAKVAPDGKITLRQKRHLFIEMTMRRVRPGAGSGQSFLQRRTAMHTWPDLRAILEVDWAIVGGVATRAYMPERMTQDLDILVSFENGQKALEQLQAAGYVHIAALAIPGNHLRSPEGIDIDLLFGTGEWVDNALKQTHEDPAGYPVLSLPYLVLLKLESSRAQDVADISRMLGGANETDLNEVRVIVAQYSPQDSEDLESLIFIGKQEWNS